jgi:hypothetical protein
VALSTLPHPTRAIMELLRVSSRVSRKKAIIARREGQSSQSRRSSEQVERGLGVRRPVTRMRPHHRVRYSTESTRAVGAEGARFVHTEEVTGSIPVPPTTVGGHIPSMDMASLRIWMTI